MSGSEPPESDPDPDSRSRSRAQTECDLKRTDPYKKNAVIANCKPRKLAEIRHFYDFLTLHYYNSSQKNLNVLCYSKKPCKTYRA